MHKVVDMDIVFCHDSRITVGLASSDGTSKEQNENRIGYSYRKKNKRTTLTIK